MHLDCPRCGRTLEYSDKRPSFCAYCGKPLPVPLEATESLEPEAATLPPAPAGRCAVPDCVGGYRLLRSLGAGGMGTVYEAEETCTGRRVALKLIAPEYAGSQETVARFRQEGRLASQVVHPRCVFVHKADEEAGLPFIVMELMPGVTLHDLVHEKGPLPAEEAVAKMLDVIDGLQEAHRLGIIHRDVKPSNCFLEADGRVKVGDFGLSRSLMSDARLTRAGAFLGTPLYAAPEQIRADPVDQQSDVYSVAATLYFLLAGRAPHQTGDAAATMARIVSEAAPPLRETRPEVSQALDEVVLRGLERDRGRRWPDLEEFRQALLPFAPGRLSAAGRALRLAAFAVDVFLLSLLEGILGLLFTWALTGNAGTYFTSEEPAPVWYRLLISAVWVLYFGLPEGVWGASPGKRPFRIRVTTAGQRDPPGLPRALLRALVVTLLLFPSWYLEPLLGFLWGGAEELGVWLLYWRMTLTLLGANLFGLVALLATMRARNGYRGLHELASGTRVISLVPRASRLVIPARRLEQEVTRPAGLPERLGPFAVLGVLAEDAGVRVLLGQDPALGRKAVIWLRPVSAPSLPPARQELTRGSRLRWLSGGVQGTEQWDAFVAPAGCALADLVARHGRLPWAEVRPLLEQLAEELAAAQADRSLPDMLCTDQVWVQPDGRACLLEFALGADRSAPAVLDDAEPGLPLVRQVAILTLEGRPRPKEDRERAIRAPLPGAAALLLQRLLGEGRLARFREDLAALGDRPARVMPAARLAHLEVLALLLSVGLFCVFLVPAGVGVERAVYLASEAREYERLLPFVHADAAAAALFSDPVSLRPVAPYLWLWSRRIHDLQETRRYYQRTHEGFTRSLSWPLRKLVALRLEIAEPEGPGKMKRLNLYRVGHYEAAPEAPLRDVAKDDAALYTSILFFPAVWVLWAWLARGGLGYRLAGLSLVRADGRRAARWQCGLRALLVWGPMVALSCLAVWLDSWQAWELVHGRDHLWAAWLAWASWWLALLLLPAYALLALWSPERAPHDRMVGTYLVPR